MRKLQNKDKVLDLINRFPLMTNVEIAKRCKCDEHTVAKYRKKIDLKYDSEFISIVAGKFIKDYSYAKNYWLNQVGRLEKLKTEELEAMEILAIEKHQTELHKNILFLASQGEVREVIKIMRAGNLPMLETIHDE